jgi:cyclophilin family peptidyl-prolyl cis-trans isomerase
MIIPPVMQSNFMISPRRIFALILASLTLPISAALVEPIGSRSVPPGGLVLNLERHFDMGNATDSFVQVSTSMGNFTLELFRDTAPKSVENFLAYVKLGAYQNAVFHRSVPGFIVQTGGFTVGSNLPAVPTNPPVVNEYNRSNLRGTVAMAKLGGDPDSATSQWFVNLADNSENLDGQNGGFTVFARVLEGGMAVWDAIAALPRYDLGGAFTDLPLQNVAEGQESIQLANLVSITRAIASPFSATSSNPLAFSATMDGNRVRVLPSVEAAKGAVITILTKDAQGNSTQTTFPVASAGSRTFIGFIEGASFPKFVSLTLSNSGAFTGVFEDGSAQRRFRGKFAWPALAPVALPITGNQTLTLNYLSNQGKIAAALVASGNASVSTLLEPVAIAGSEVPNLQPSTTNALLMPRVQGTTGCGFARLLIQKSGSVSILGTLPDGVPFSAAARLRTPDAEEVSAVPLAVYWRGKTPSVLAGTMSLSTSPTPSSVSISGNLSWTQSSKAKRPAGTGVGPFTLDLYGSLWSSSAGVNALTGISGNRTFGLELNFPKSDDFTLEGTWPATNKPTLVAEAQFAGFAFDQTLGRFSGFFRKNTAIPFTRFQGLLLAKPLVLQNGILLHGGGWIPEGNATGPVWILSRP